jgi:site-specific recombinase XerD
MKSFESFLAPWLREYVTYRDNLGYARGPTFSHLMTFDRYVQRCMADQALLQPSFFLEFRKDLKLEPRSVNRILSSARVFFQFLVRKEYYSQNPLQDVPDLTEGVIVPFVFSPKQIDQLLNAVCSRLPKNQNTFLVELAIYVAIVFLARCGMRITEPLRLLRNHYRPEERTLYIEKTKFKKDRLIPIPKSVAVELENYLAVRNVLLPNDYSQYLLVNYKQNHLSDAQVRRRFHMAVKNIGIWQPRRIICNMNFSAPTPHSLRHSFAINTLKHAIARGLSTENVLPILATYMGHSEYKHTVKYLKFIDAEQRDGLADFVKTRYRPR